MIQSKDYRAYLCDNTNLLNALQERNSILVSRLEDVKKVLDHICNLERIKKNISDDYVVIFETGFSYFHEELELIKIYYNNYFNKDINLLIKYQNAINYVLYLEDLSEALSEKNKLSEEGKNKFTEIIKILDNKIQNQNEITENELNDYDCIIENYLPNDNIYTTDYIYSLILEEIKK